MNLHHFGNVLGSELTIFSICTVYIYIYCIYITLSWLFPSPGVYFLSPRTINLRPLRRTEIVIPRHRGPPCDAKFERYGGPRMEVISEVMGPRKKAKKKWVTGDFLTPYFLGYKL